MMYFVLVAMAEAVEAIVERGKVDLETVLKVLGLDPVEAIVSVFECHADDVV